MIWSGLLIYWANDVYDVRIGGVTLFHFFPDWFYRALNLELGLAAGMAYHFTFMWLFAINGFLYVLYTFAVRRVAAPAAQPAHARARRGKWCCTTSDCGRQPLPRAKFNGAQRIAYTGVILMGAGSLVTGLAIYKPTQLAWLTSLLGGYEWARAEHFTLTVGYVLFFVVHIAQVVRAGWNNFRAMVTGYELAPVEETSHV